MRTFEYIFAPIGACLVLIIFLGAFSASRIDFFPLPALLMGIFTIAYFSFRKRLDRSTDFERHRVRAAAVVGACALVVAAILAMMILHLYATPAGFGYGSEWVDGSVQTSSTTELLDMFMASQKFLELRGFQPAEPASSGMGMKSGLISPHMATFYYKGSYLGSPPFIIRLDIDRDGKQLIAYADPAASTKAAYDAQEMPSRNFVTFFNKTINNELATYRKQPAPQ